MIARTPAEEAALEPIVRAVVARYAGVPANDRTLLGRSREPAGMGTRVAARLVQELYQEAWAALLAGDPYDPAYGVPYAAYAARTARDAVRKLVQVEQAARLAYPGEPGEPADGDAPYVPPVGELLDEARLVAAVRARVGELVGAAHAAAAIELCCEPLSTKDHEGGETKAAELARRWGLKDTRAVANLKARLKPAFDGDAVLRELWERLPRRRGG